MSDKAFYFALWLSPLHTTHQLTLIISSVPASNKADYGLDDLQHLNVKDRFSVFERPAEEEPERNTAAVEVKRSQSILDKMKR